MFRNLPLLLAAVAIVLAIGGLARIFFAPRRPVRGGFVESLPTTRVPSKRSIETNYGAF